VSGSGDKFHTCADGEQRWSLWAAAVACTSFLAKQGSSICRANKLENRPWGKPLSFPLFLISFYFSLRCTEICKTKAFALHCAFGFVSLG